jgi:hypothetical protein
MGALVTEPDPAWIGLVDAVNGVRTELQRAVNTGRGQEPRLVVETIEMEFVVELQKERGHAGGVQVWVVSADSSRANRSSSAHRIMVQLKPEAPLTISDRSDGGLAPRRSRG